MALRFSKRIKVAPGLTLNLSKSGIGASLGPRGAKISVSKRGVHGSAGIPGTGLSYRTRLSGPSGRGRQSARRTTASPQSPAQQLDAMLTRGEDLPVIVAVDDQGQIEIRDGAGEAFDAAELRVLKRHMGDSLRELVEAECERLNADLDRLGWVSFSEDGCTECQESIAPSGLAAVA